MGVPFEIGNFVLEPGKFIICLNISLKVEALHRSNVLASIFNVFSNYNIPVLAVKTSASESKNFIRVTVFADFTKNRGFLKKVVENIKSLNYVENVKIVEPLFNGLTMDTSYTHLTLAGGRAIILRKPIYEGFIKGFRERFGQVASSFLYHIGFEAGRKAYKSHLRIVSEAHRGVEKIIPFARELFKQIGFGILEFTKVDFLNKTALIRVRNSFECELFKETGMAESHFIRGLIAGFMSSLFGIKVDAEETKCVAKGDPYCEFVVGQKLW